VGRDRIGSGGSAESLINVKRCGVSCKTSGFEIVVKVGVVRVAREDQSPGGR